MNGYKINLTEAMGQLFNLAKDRSTAKSNRDNAMTILDTLKEENSVHKIDGYLNVEGSIASAGRWLKIKYGINTEGWNENQRYRNFISAISKISYFVDERNNVLRSN
ncbi:MAG: hypothetical protein ABUK01_04250 [Leptospirales bacterium]